jgi:hypothetical protein
MLRIPTHREPTHPGDMLLEEFLAPMGITQRQLSECNRRRIAASGTSRPFSRDRYQGAGDNL